MPPQPARARLRIHHLLWRGHDPVRKRETGCDLFENRRSGAKHINPANRVVDAGTPRIGEPEVPLPVEAEIIGPVRRRRVHRQHPLIRGPQNRPVAFVGDVEGAVGPEGKRSRDALHPVSGRVEQAPRVARSIGVRGHNVATNDGRIAVAGEAAHIENPPSRPKSRPFWSGHAVGDQLPARGHRSRRHTEAPQIRAPASSKTWMAPGSASTRTVSPGRTSASASARTTTDRPSPRSTSR